MPTPSPHALMSRSELGGGRSECDNAKLRQGHCQFDGSLDWGISPLYLPLNQSGAFIVKPKIRHKV